MPAKKAKSKKLNKKSKEKSYLSSFNYAGIVAGSVFVILGFGPSLVPRAWFMQAAINGVLFSIGYGLGVFVSYIIREFKPKEPSKQIKNKIKLVTLALIGIGYIVALSLGHVWQKEIHRLMSMDEPVPFSLIGTSLLTLLVIMLLIWVARIIRTFFRWARKTIDRWLPIKIANALAIAATVFLVYGIIDGFILQGAYNFVNKSFSITNDTTPEGIERQNLPTVSGSDESLITWESLGKQGRKFIGKVATTQALSEQNNTPAMNPVRIYSGIESADNVNARAQLAVKDLVRAGGLNRDVLVVVTTTGTGWVDEQGVDPIEYMYNGNSAIVAMQYSYLPSWISFLVDQQKAKDAGIALFDAVYEEWSKLPADQRPKLVSFGESLGAFGSNAAFPAVSSFKATSEGALWVGPPNSTTLWSNIVSQRDLGSTMVLPIYQEGQNIRFAGKSGELALPSNEWQEPKAVYLQHPSDPIVWWSPSLIYSKPDWYNEPRGFDVSPATRWFPIITFWQISADMAFANSVPDGHGHKYGTLPVDAWSYIAPSEGWNQQKAESLREYLNSRP